MTFQGSGPHLHHGRVCGCARVVGGRAPRVERSRLLRLRGCGRALLQVVGRAHGSLVLTRLCLVVQMFCPARASVPVVSEEAADGTLEVGLAPSGKSSAGALLARQLFVFFLLADWQDGGGWYNAATHALNQRTPRHHPHPGKLAHTPMLEGAL